MRTGEEGPVPARAADGSIPDVLEVTERLGREFGRLYVVDLDGIDRNRPQLDYLQEIARDGEMWVDGGARSAEEVIDLLVTGAYRAVLSTARLTDARELKRAWKMSSDLAFEVEVRPRGVDGSAAWRGRSPGEVASEVRAVGVTDLVASFREQVVDWTVVRELAEGGAVWVDGSFERAEEGRLEGAHAAGGIFHLDAWLDGFRPATTPEENRGRRDDESRTS